MEEGEVDSGLRKKLISAGLIIITLATVAVQMFLLKKTDKKNAPRSSTEAIMVDPNNQVKYVRFFISLQDDSDQSSRW